MADHDYVPGSMDVTQQKGTFSGVMKFSGYWGLPLSLALGAFFTALLRDSGLFGGFALFVVVFIFTHIGVKTFFSH